MGYSTDFEGILKFKSKVTTDELQELSKYLEQDRREIGIDEVEAYSTDEDYWYHIDIRVAKDYSGLEWNGSEKTYGMVSIVNFLTKKLREKFPKFELEGKLFAQGEEFDDRWELVMEKGIAKKVELKIKGKKITCPHCEEKFIDEEK